MASTAQGRPLPGRRARRRGHVEARAEPVAGRGLSDVSELGRQILGIPDRLSPDVRRQASPMCNVARGHRVNGRGPGGWPLLEGAP